MKKVKCMYRDSSFLKYGKIYEVLKESETSYSVTDEEGCEAFFYKWKFEEVKEVTKTFEEVVVDIKEGETWVGRNFEISKDVVDGSIIIRTLDGKDIDSHGIYFEDKEVFRLKRKKCTFKEAFKAYEEGKEVEDFNGYKYKKIDGVDHYKASFEVEFSTKSSECDYWFGFDEIRNEWYIND